MQAGALRAGAESGLDVWWKGPAREDDRDEQIKVVENAITRGVKGIVIAPLDEKALVPCLKEAAKAGIPVVVFDSGLQWDGQKSFVATDNEKGGQVAAREARPARWFIARSGRSAAAPGGGRAGGPSCPTR